MKLWKMFKNMVTKDQIQKRINLLSTEEVDRKINDVTNEFGTLVGGVLHSTIKGIIKYASENVEETSEFYQKHEKVYKSYYKLLESLFETDFVNDIIEISNKQFQAVSDDIGNNQKQADIVVEKVNILLNDENLTKVVNGGII